MDEGIRPAFPASVVAVIVIAAVVGLQLAAGGRASPGWDDGRTGAGLACAAGGAGSPQRGEGGDMTARNRSVTEGLGASGNLQVATFALG